MTAAALLLACGLVHAREASEPVIRLNKTHGVWHFIRALSQKETDSQKLLAQAFDSSPYNTPERRESISRCKTLCPDHWLGRLIIDSAYAQDTADLSKRIAEFVPEAELSLLSEFEPVYDELVWKSSLGSLSAKAESLGRVRLERFVAPAAVFYRAKIEEPVLVTLVPIPGDERGALFFTRVVDNVVSKETGVGEPRPMEDASTVFHEICHILYAKRKPKFLPREDPDYNLLNEGLASAMGIWMLRQSSSEPPQDWHGYPRVSAYAKRLYPRVVEYIRKLRPMDDAFLAFARAQYRAMPGFEKTLAKLKKMRPADPDRAKSLVINTLKVMAEDIRWIGDSQDQTPRDPHEWSGRQVVGAGTFNGCVEAAKAFKSLYDAAGPPAASKYVGGTLKGKEGGHAVVEVADFLVDTAMFPSLSPSMSEAGGTIQTGKEDVNVQPEGTGFLLRRYQYQHLFQEDRKIGTPIRLKDIAAVNRWLRKNASVMRTFDDLEKSGIILREDNGKFRGPDGETMYIYQKTAQDPFNGTEEQRHKLEDGAMEEAVKAKP